MSSAGSAGEVGQAGSAGAVGEAGARLRRLRDVHAGRGGADAPDLVYAGYVVVLLVLFIGVPLLLAAVRALSGDEVAGAVFSAAGERGLRIGVGGFLAAAAACGRVYGPVTPEPFFVTLLVGTDLPRALALRRPFLLATAVAAVPLATAGLVAGLTFLANGVLSGPGLVRFLAVVAAVIVLAAWLWLAGQVLPDRWAWVLPGVVLTLTGTGLLVPAADVPTPWGWAARAVVGHDGTAWAAAVLLVVTAGAAVVTVPVLLSATSGPRLRADAERRQITRTAAFSGEITVALDVYRARPGLGRTWRAVRGRPAPVRFLVRDLVAGARTPVRFSVGCLTLVVGLGLTAHAPGLLVAGAGSGLVYLALGVFSDGFRHAAQAGAGPPLYGVGVAELFVVHSLLPLTALLVTAVAVGGTGVVAAGLLLVAVRAYDSAKGPLPPILLTPVASPAGDLSSLNVLIWQADAALISVFCGAVIAVAQPVHAAVAATVIVALLLAGLRRRLHRL
ncbi:hypothetical protein KIH74_30925 [Kineosporia sp. J2-2]|uniref:ABC-2 type transport system permease protein n=1 Tax=Kineosporia corallincola TaxID=2835133 RepID=A0ABS5TRH6_9ACTN|nr:hypothetical protein [Kineosporia corallincola]MBT0773400.1 hypothetical protein [Kineosporia corallincola]